MNPCIHARGLLAGIKRPELGLNLGVSSLISQEPNLILFVPYLFPEVQSLFLEALDIQGLP